MITKAKAIVRSDGTAVESSGLAPSAHELVRLLIATATAFVALLALTAAPASALTTHVFSTSFGSAGSGDGQVSLAGNSGVAVNTTSHDVYVADTHNARVDQFSSSGTFIRAFGADVGGAGINVCTTGCAAGTPGSAPGAFTAPTFVAVDNSCFEQGLSGAACTSFDPSNGDVYVGDNGDNLVSKFDASGTLITFWGDGGTCPAAPNGQLSGAPGSGCATDGPFNILLAGVAVDSAGTLDVLDLTPRLFKFAQDGTFSTDFTVPRSTFVFGLAVDPAGSFFKVNSDRSVEKIDGSGSDIAQVTATDAAFGLAVDSTSGDLYVDNNGASVSHYAFDGSGNVIEPGPSCAPAPFSGCSPTDSFGSGHMSGAAGLAADPTSNHLYAADTGNARIDLFTPITVPTVATAAASAVQPTTATLHGTVNPDGVQVSDCHFDYGTDTSYGQTAQCLRDDNNGTDIGSGSSDVAVHADLSGLDPGTTYHFRLVATNANGTNPGSDLTFFTPPPPSIDAAAASGLTSTSADLSAQINPNGFQLTDCHFEWGTDTSYGQSADCSPDAASIPPDSADHLVSAHLTGLTANTTYHWRVLATSANGTTTGSDHTFVYDTNGGGLPDGRAYEQVTPPHKNGSLVGDVALGLPRDISNSGDRVISENIQCFAAATSCIASRRSVGTPFQFDRTATGWTTTPLAPPATQFDSNTAWDYSADAGAALFSAPTQPSGEDDFYARRPDGTFAQIGPAMPPSGGEQGPSPLESTLETADLSHVVYVLDRDLWPFDSTSSGLTGSLYEYVGTCGTPTACQAAQPLLVGVGGPSDGPGSTDLISTCGTQPAAVNLEVRFPLSSDGRTIYFTSRGEDDPNCSSASVFGSGANSGTEVPADALYARIDNELPSAHTVAISERSPADCTTPACTTSPPSDAQFESASDTGAKAYFTSTQKLTDSATQDPSSGDSATAGGGCPATTGPNGCNLYLYDFSRPAGHQLTAVSAGDVSGGGPRLQGLMAVSRDGSHAYFVARGVLTTAPNAQGQTATDGADNLYAYDAATGDTSYIASLPSSDADEWSANPTSNLTPDGRFLVFTSRAALTPDTGAAGVQQVFRYDAQSGDLIRLSIGNDGFNDNGNQPASTLCIGRFCPDAANIVRPSFGGRDRTDPTMSDDGSYVFFQSPVGLTPQALDSVQTGTDEHGNPIYAQNVYQWHAGHVSLISDGRDANTTTAPENCPELHAAVCLIGTDSTGRNVFFTTADSLVSQDTDTQVDFYDARIAGGFPAAPPPQPCSGDSCQGPPTGSPPDQTPGSSGFSGPGNPTPSRQRPATKRKCKKHKKLKKGKCVKKHSRAASTTRRAGR